MPLTAEDIRLINEIIEQRVKDIKVSREEFNLLRDLIVKMDQRLSLVEDRLTRLEEIIAKLNQIITLLEERVTKLEEKLEDRTMKIEEIIKQLAEIQLKSEESLKRFEREFTIKIGALGTRWGISSEFAFREALKGILAERGYQVESFLKFDSEGFVFGKPDQVEIDLIIKDSRTAAIEIKSPLNKADIATFYRKVLFYEKSTGRTVSEKIAVSPFIDPRGTKELAQKLEIKIFTGPEEVKFEQQET